MFNLAIECSGIAGSIALFRSRELLGSQSLDSKASSVQTLAPAIVRLLAAAEISRVDLISVTAGPGSFTGLRVGLATAKMLAFAWNCPVAAVDTLEAIALRASKQCSGSTYLLPSINAYRNQLFVGCWLSQEDKLRRCTQSHLANADEWKLNPASSFEAAQTDPSLPIPSQLSQDNQFDYQLTGPGLEKYQPTGEFRQTDPSLWNPQAIEVGELGWRRYTKDQLETATTLQANYVRSSAAEENAKRRA